MAGPRFGVSAALVTPLDEAGGVDVRKLAAHLDDLITRGCVGGTVFGTTGEGPSFSFAERTRTADALIALGIPASRLVEGVIVCSADEASASLAAAARRGSAAVLLAPPHYFRPPGGDEDDDALFAWFSAALNGAGASVPPVLLYHIPAMTGVPLSFALIARLRAAFPGAILGVKDSACDPAHSNALLAAHGDLAILVGDESYLGSACARGAAGAICGLANALPERVVALVAAKRNDEAVIDLLDAMRATPTVPAVRALTAAFRSDPAFLAPRPPLRAVDAGTAEALDAALARARAAPRLEPDARRPAPSLAEAG